MNLKEQFEAETGKPSEYLLQESDIGNKIFSYEYFNWLEAKVLAQQEAVSLLRDLADLQNGAPLERHRKEWEETMSQVYDFLNKWEPTTLI